MGEVVSLSEVRAARRRSHRAPKRQRVEFFFDLGCPFSYLAAEPVDRAFDDVIWTPASAATLQRRTPEHDDAWQARIRAAAEQRARELRVPLVWPDAFPAAVPAAMRAAAYAAERHRGAAFVIAAGRLAFCGGFALEDPETLAEAAAAAGIPLDGCLEAAGDVGRDGAIEEAGRRLLAAGADRLPALRLERTLAWGERKVTEAAGAATLVRSARR